MSIFMEEYQKEVTFGRGEKMKAWNGDQTDKDREDWKKKAKAAKL
jgi:hypothetical protein